MSGEAAGPHGLWQGDWMRRCSRGPGCPSPGGISCSTVPQHHYLPARLVDGRRQKEGRKEGKMEGWKEGRKGEKEDRVWLCKDCLEKGMSSKVITNLELKLLHSHSEIPLKETASETLTQRPEGGEDR